MPPITPSARRWRFLFIFCSQPVRSPLTNVVEKCIIMGDFNCTPDSSELKPLFERFNCTDINDYTFPSDSPVKKIDYIFLSRDIEITDKGTSPNVISDHRSQWVSIRE